MQLKQSKLGVVTMGLLANLDLATARALTDLRVYIKGNLKYRPMCSEIWTIEVYLVAIPSGNPLVLATSTGFSDLDPCDGG